MLKLRKAKQADVDAILDIWCELMDFHEQFDPTFKRARNGHKAFGKYLSSQITSRKAIVLLAVEDGKIQGYLLAHTAEKPPVFAARKYGMITDLAVTEANRRGGIGTKLYEESIEWFKSKKIERIELGVTTSNPVSYAFWSKLGYKAYYSKLYRNIVPEQ